MEFMRLGEMRPVESYSGSRVELFGAARQWTRVPGGVWQLLLTFPYIPRTQAEEFTAFWNAVGRDAFGVQMRFFNPPRRRDVLDLADFAGANIAVDSLGADGVIFLRGAAHGDIARGQWLTAGGWLYRATDSAGRGADGMIRIPVAPFYHQHPPQSERVEIIDPIFIGRIVDRELPAVDFDGTGGLRDYVVSVRGQPPQ